MMMRQKPHANLPARDFSHFIWIISYIFASLFLAQVLFHAIFISAYFILSSLNAEQIFSLFHHMISLHSYGTILNGICKHFFRSRFLIGFFPLSGVCQKYLNEAKTNILKHNTIYDMFCCRTNMRILGHDSVFTTVIPLFFSISM